jgi:hypothetical protein
MFGVSGAAADVAGEAGCVAGLSSNGLRSCESAASSRCCDGDGGRSWPVQGVSAASLGAGSYSVILETGLDLSRCAEVQRLCRSLGGRTGSERTPLSTRRWTGATLSADRTAACDGGRGQRLRSPVQLAVSAWSGSHTVSAVRQPLGRLKSLRLPQWTTSHYQSMQHNIVHLVNWIRTR